MIILTDAEPRPPPDAEPRPPRPQLTVPSWIVNEAIKQLCADAALERRMFPPLLYGPNGRLIGQTYQPGDTIRVGRTIRAGA